MSLNRIYARLPLTTSSSSSSTQNTTVELIGSPLSNIRIHGGNQDWEQQQIIAFTAFLNRYLCLLPPINNS